MSDKDTNLIVPSGKDSMVPMTDIVGLSNSTILSPSQKASIELALKSGAYDMASEFIWRRTMSKLKEILSEFGIEFLADMLERSDVKPYDSMDSILNDYNIIKLSEQLGMIPENAAIHLRHSSELLQYYFSTNSLYHDDPLSAVDALTIINSCVKYVLNVPDIRIDFEFSELKGKLIEEDLKEEDAEIQKLTRSSLFFIRTILTLLINYVKKGKGIELDHSVNNFGMLIPLIWDRLTKDDKWKIGESYRDTFTDGNEKASKGIRSALTKVQGFDYVPESLRSDTFKSIAQHLIEVHYAFNNYYNEPRAVRELHKLGSVIPDPAFALCIKAYLLVYTGNYYGVSNEAVPIAEEELHKISADRWILFFEEILPNDYDLLSNFEDERPMNRMKTLIGSLSLGDFENGSKLGGYLYNSCRLGLRKNIFDFRRNRVKIQ